MKLKKQKGTYDNVTAELSYAELMAWRDGCRALGGPIADESAKAIDWYLSNETLGPGEESDAKAGPGGEDAQLEIGAEGPKGEIEADLDVPPAPGGAEDAPPLEPDLEADADAILPRD